MKPSFLILLFVSLPLSGNQAAGQIPVVDPVSSAYLLKLSLGLGFILLLIFGLAWLMKKMQLTQHSQNGLIRIISAISVGPRDRIALIQVGEEQILVGLTPGRIEKLHTLISPLETEDHRGDNGSFAHKFNQLIKREKVDAD